MKSEDFNNQYLIHFFSKISKRRWQEWWSKWPKFKKKILSRVNKNALFCYQCLLKFAHSKQIKTIKSKEFGFNTIFQSKKSHSWSKMVKITNISWVGSICMVLFLGSSLQFVENMINKSMTTKEYDIFNAFFSKKGKKGIF